MQAKVVVNRRPYSILPSPCSRIRVFRSVTSCRKLNFSSSDKKKKFKSITENKSVNRFFFFFFLLSFYYKDEKKMKLRALVLLPVFVVGEKSVGPNIIEQDEKQTNKNRRLLESIEKTF